MRSALAILATLPYGYLKAVLPYLTVSDLRISIRVTKVVRGGDRYRRRELRGEGGGNEGTYDVPN